MSEPTRYAKGGVIAGRGIPPCKRNHLWGGPERVIGSDLQPWPFLVRLCRVCAAIIRYEPESDA